MKSNRRRVKKSPPEARLFSVADVIERLKQHADPRNLEGMARYGMNVNKRLGVSVPHMRALAKEVGRDHRLALALWKTGIAEARIVASMIDDPAEVTAGQMEQWVRDFDSWDVCDQVCMNLFEKAVPARQKVREWAIREEEYVKRAAFALIACIAWHDKNAPDATLTNLFPLLKRGADDERNYVKKAVSWAIRTIGKRNRKLNLAAVTLAREIRQTGAKGALWVATDVLKELESEAVRNRLTGKSQ